MLNTCTVHHPYSDGDPGHWEHPSASQTFDTDYRQHYHCPICGLNFRMELAE